MITKTHSSFLRMLAIAVSAMVAAFAAEVSAQAAPCNVFVELGGPSIPHTFPWCVAQSNAAPGIPIQITAPGMYQPPGTVTFTRSTTVTGFPGAVLLPADPFTGTNLIQIGGSCAPFCTGTSFVTWNDIEIGAEGATDIRAMLVQPSSGIQGNNLHIAGFDNALDGGAIRAFHSTDIYLDGCLFEENWGARGGAIFSTGAHVDIDDSTFQNNGADSLGGAIYIDPNSATLKSLAVSDSEFFSNVGSQGGAIYAQGGYGSITASVTTSDFSDNTAELGGAYYGSGTLSNSFFESNTATQGGALALTRTSSVSRSTLYSNKGKLGAGLAFIPETAAEALTVAESSFEKNYFIAVSGARGGGVYLSNGSNHVIGNSTFYSNGSLGAAGQLTTGGGIAVFNGAKVDVVHVSMRSNVANTGGGVAVSNSTATLRSSAVAQSTNGNCSNSGGTIGQATSLSSDATCLGFTYVSSNPQLPIPAANGGPTHTMLPPLTSILLGHGNCYRTIDQRALARPAANCDIGSVER